MISQALAEQMRARAIIPETITDPQALDAGTVLRYAFGGTPIYLETHPEVWSPTQFTLGMCDLIARQRHDGKKILDFASGSGILGIVSAAYGAQSVLFVDLNPQALIMTARNWLLNGFQPASMQLKRSDCFTALVDDAKQRAAYDLIVSNPPTAIDTPERLSARLNRTAPISAADWNGNGEDGRLVTDALITQSRQFLREGGEILFVTTSKQGPNRTRDLLMEHWGRGLSKPGTDPLDYVRPLDNGPYNWSVVARIDVPLSDWYRPYLVQYEQLAAGRGEPKPVLIGSDGQLFQRLYFIRARKR